MFFRTVSILALLTLSTTVQAEEPPTTTPAPTKAETAPTGDLTNGGTPASKAPSADAGTPQTPSDTENGTKAPASTDGANRGENNDTEGATEGSLEGEDKSTAATTEGNPEGQAEQPPVVQEAVKQEPVKSEPVAEAAHEEGGHSGSFTVEEMWTQSSGPVRIVLGTLLFMLVAAMGVGLERLITLQTARSQSRRLAGEVGALLNEGKIKAALDVCAREDMNKSYLGHLLSAGLIEFESREDQHGIDAVERAIEKNAITETASLNKGLNILATVGSTAPFVGLVGTIFGIINAFGQIGAEGGADLTTLAPAIGEALITTAFGIIVAIAGVWLFNFFNAMIGSIMNDMAESSQEFVDWCYKRIRPEKVQKSAK
jgi:biopolymer transport protein TolQ